MLPTSFDGRGRYELVRQLGTGGMGIVYEARDLESGHLVALKTLLRAEPDTIYRLKREFRALSDLTHPNLVGLYDMHMDGDQCFFTMELVRGVHFLRYCRAGPDRTDAMATTEVGGSGPVSDERKLRRGLRQLAAGLHAIHQAGKIHRDIKPSNVLVTEDERVVILDFGLIAEADGRDRSQSGAAVGTPVYMAPEIVSGESFGPASDWYSLGVLLYEALTGRPPFGGTGPKVMMDKVRRLPPPPRAIDDAVPPDLDELCVELLATDPRQRPRGEEILERVGAREPTPAFALASRSRTRDWLVVGRKDELRQLGTLMEGVVTGKPASVLIRGDAGMGKTELARAFLRQLAEQYTDAVVLEGRCYPQESVPYKAFDPLVDHLSRIWLRMPEAEATELVPRNAALLPRLFPVLGRVPAVAEARTRLALSDPQELRTRGFEALRSVLQRLAERRPVVMLLDDMQWVDGDTVALLTDVLRPPDPPQLMLVCCVRTEPPDKPQSPLDRLSTLEHLLTDLAGSLVTIDCGPLEPDAAVDLCEHMLPGRANLVADVVREAAGNPTLLRELTHHVLGKQVDELQHVRLEEMLEERIRGLQPSAQSILRVLAVARGAVTARALQTASGVGRDQLARDLRVLRVAMFLRAGGTRSDDEVELADERIAGAVREHLLGGDDADLHRRLALALERWQDGSATQLARHWLAAGNAERATDYAITAAEQATAKLDFERAAGLYGFALRHGQVAAEQRIDLLVELGEARSNAGQPKLAAEAFAEAAEQKSGSRRLELRRRAAEELLRGGYLEAGMAAVRLVLEQLHDRFPESPRRALISLVWRRVRLRLRGLRTRFRDAAEIVPEALVRADVHWSVGVGFTFVSPIHGAYFHSRCLYDSLRLGERRRIVRALAWDAGHLSSQLYGARARALVDLMRDMADEHDAMWVNWAQTAIAYYLDNAWDRVIAHAEAVVEEGAARASPHEIDSAHALQCWSLLYRGRIAEVAERYFAYVREADRRGNRYQAVWLRARMPAVWLARGDPASAVNDVSRGLAQWPSDDHGYHVPHYFELHSSVEIALYRDRPERALRLIESHAPRLKRSLLLRVGMVRLEMLYLEARVRLAMWRRDGDCGHLDRVAALVRQLPSGGPLGADLALVVAAALAAARGDADGAAARMREAIEALEGHGTDLYARAARWRLGQAIGDESLHAEAAAEMTRAGIDTVEAFAAMLVPDCRAPTSISR